MAWILAAGCESDETTPAGATSTTVSNATSATSTSAQGGGPGAGGTGQGGQGGGQGGGFEGPCGEICANGGEPNPGCLNCVTTNCNDQFTACLADTGAGGAGVGGAGVGGTAGAGGTGPCSSCAEVAGGGDPSSICPESEPLLNALFLCVCGDATMPGECG